MDCQKPPKKCRAKGVKKVYAVKCSVPLCQGNSQKDPQLSWHSFPSDPKLRDEWVFRIGSTAKFGSWQPKKHHKICGIHFNKSGSRGFKDKLPMPFHCTDFSAVNKLLEQVKHVYRKPTVPACQEGNLLPLEKEAEAVVPLVSSRFIQVVPAKKRTLQNKIKIDVHKELNNQMDHMYSKSLPSVPTSQEDNSLPLEKEAEAATPSVPHINNDHNYFASSEEDILKTLGETTRLLGSVQDINKDLEKRNEDILKILEEKTHSLGSMLDINKELEKKNEELSNENKELKEKLSLLERRCSAQQLALEINNDKLVQKTFRLGSVIKDAKKVRFYTGFESGESLVKFLDIVVEGYKQKFPSKKPTGRPLSLDNQNQIFLVLCRLNKKFREDDLAQRFEISKSTVSKVWSIWSTFLLTYLRTVPSWPGKGQVKYLRFNRLCEIIKDLQEFRSANKKTKTGIKKVRKNAPDKDWNQLPEAELFETIESISL